MGWKSKRRVSRGIQSLGTLDKIVAKWRFESVSGEPTGDDVDVWNAVG